MPTHHIFNYLCFLSNEQSDHFLRPLNGVQNPFMEEFEDQIISYAKCSITLVPSYNALITTTWIIPVSILVLFNIIMYMTLKYTLQLRYGTYVLPL